MEMQSAKLAKPRPSESTQKYLDISEIKNDCIILKDGSLRAVIAVSSTNFALKSEEEQNALTSSYQSFLNSLDCPIQILIHSRVLDINGYLEKLKELSLSQTNELLRIQMTEYIEYVGKLVDFASIMSKNFYVVIPYSVNTGKESFSGKILKLLNPAAKVVGSEEDFERARAKLAERTTRILTELSSMGMRSVILNTAELIELLYQSYNFDSATPFHANTLQELDIKKSLS